MKTLLVLLALTMSVSAIARDDRGVIELSDGNSILRIDIGDERNQDSREMARRLYNLERAVRLLQNRVYDLEDDQRPHRPQPREVLIHVCSMTTSFNGTFIGKATSELEARANTVKTCKAADAPFCESNQIRCERTVVRQ